MKLGELFNIITNLGVEEKRPHSRLVETSSELEIRAIGLAAAAQDLKDDVIVIDEADKSYPDPLVYLVESDLTRQVIDSRYGSLLRNMGIEPIIRTKKVKKGDNQMVSVIDIPLLDAQVVLAYGDLGGQVPRLYCGNHLDKESGDFNKCGAEARELYARFALGRIGSLKEQIRVERSGALRGRIQNVAEDMATTVRKKARRAFHPHITALPIEKNLTSGFFLTF